MLEIFVPGGWFPRTWSSILTVAPESAMRVSPVFELDLRAKTSEGFGMEKRSGLAGARLRVSAVGMIVASQRQWDYAAPHALCFSPPEVANAVQQAGVELERIEVETCRVEQLGLVCYRRRIGRDANWLACPPPHCAAMSAAAAAAAAAATLPGHECVGFELCPTQ